MFFIIDNEEYLIYTQYDNYLAVHKEPEHKTYFRTSTVPHGQFCTWKRYFFLLIDRLVCTIHSIQTLDVLIKYVA